MRANERERERENVRGRNGRRRASVGREEEKNNLNVREVKNGEIDLNKQKKKTVK